MGRENLLLALLLAAGCAGWCQEDIVAPIAKEELLWWEMDTAAARMANAVLSRLVAPQKSWEEVPGTETVPEDKERCFALIVIPENRNLDRVIGIRIRFDYLKERVVYTINEGIPDAESMRSYIFRKCSIARAEMRERLMLAFEQDFESPINVFTFGKPAFILLPTEHSDVEKFRKEDIVRE